MSTLYHDCIIAKITQICNTGIFTQFTPNPVLHHSWVTAGSEMKIHNISYIYTQTEHMFVSAIHHNWVTAGSKTHQMVKIGVDTPRFM
jgi:hypothetical protein